MFEGLVIWGILLALFIGFILLIVFGWPAIGRVWFDLDTRGRDRGRWWGMYWIFVVSTAVLTVLGNRNTDEAAIVGFVLFLLFLAAWHPLGLWSRAARGRGGKWWLFLLAMAIPLVNYVVLLAAIVMDRRR